MPIFNYEFVVSAPQEAVANLHRDTGVLKKLTPPPIFVQIHDYEPLQEGSVADFTLWFGPIPVHWRAIHSNVSDNGFTDTQLRGPLKNWQHSHRFTALDNATTQVAEHIVYEYESGLLGLVGRLLFSRPSLFLLFTARKLITRRMLRDSQEDWAVELGDSRKRGRN